MLILAGRDAKAWLVKGHRPGGVRVIRGIDVGKQGRGHQMGGAGENGRRPLRPARGKAPARGPGPLRLAPIPGRENSFELVHPRCVEEARLDYEEGLELWKAGDPDEARDALRYALQACGDNLWVHAALGKIAFQEFKDAVLARGHYGYAVELVRRSLAPGFTGQLPRNREANRPFYEAIDGLIACLLALKLDRDADELAELRARLGGERRPPG